MRRNNIFFLQQTMAGTTAHVSGKQTFISSSGFPPPGFSFAKTTRSRLSGPRRNTNSYDPACLSHKHTHTKGGIPNNRQNNKVEIDHRAAPRRTSPRLLSLSPFSSRRDIQPRGALRVVVRIDSCDGIRAPSSLSPRNQRRSLYSACR